eukprot:137900-Rhodomonas_salina.1
MVWRHLVSLTWARHVYAVAMPDTETAFGPRRSTNGARTHAPWPFSSTASWSTTRKTRCLSSMPRPCRRRTRASGPTARSGRTRGRGGRTTR